MKNILITGGCGFIGTNLSLFLKKKNNIVYCIDNNYTKNTDNINVLLKHNITIINHNIIEPLNLNIKFDEIYHLACLPLQKYIKKSYFYI